MATGEAFGEQLSPHLGVPVTVDAALSPYHPQRRAQGVGGGRTVGQGLLPFLGKKEHVSP